MGTTRAMELRTLEDTRSLARSLVELAPPGTLILLIGALGAGKTTLVQQLGLELGSDATITSPTYTLIHEYPTPEGTLVHVDAYRLPQVAALLDLGLEDYLERSRLVVVEWGEGLVEPYPDAVVVRLKLEGEGRHAEVASPHDRT